MVCLRGKRVSPVKPAGGTLPPKSEPIAKSPQRRRLALREQLRGAAAGSALGQEGPQLQRRLLARCGLAPLSTRVELFEDNPFWADSERKRHCSFFGGGGSQKKGLSLFFVSLKAKSRGVGFRGFGVGTSWIAQGKQPADSPGHIVVG